MANEIILIKNDKFGKVDDLYTSTLQQMAFVYFFTMALYKTRTTKNIVLMMVDSFKLKVGNCRYDQREFFNRNIAWVQAKTTFFAKANFF